MYLEREEVQLEVHVKKNLKKKTSPLQKLSFTGKMLKFRQNAADEKSEL